MTRGVSHTPQTLAQHDDDDQHHEPDDQNFDRYDGDDDDNDDNNVDDGDDTISSRSWEPPTPTHMDKRCDTFCSKDQDFHLVLFLRSHTDYI